MTNIENIELSITKDFYAKLKFPNGLVRTVKIDDTLSFSLPTLYLLTMRIITEFYNREKYDFCK